MLDLLLAVQLTVYDGDTFKEDLTRYRLAKIDAPELKQPYGREAQQALNTQLINGYKKTILKKEKYGRSLVLLKHRNRDINLFLVKNGCAWRYYTTDQTYIKAEKYARNHHLGLWANPNPVPPWEYRKRK